jgi:hypothetical protein
MPQNVRFAVLIAVTMMITVFWVVTDVHRFWKNMLPTFSETFEDIYLTTWQDAVIFMPQNVTIAFWFFKES